MRGQSGKGRKRRLRATSNTENTQSQQEQKKYVPRFGCKRARVSGSKNSGDNQEIPFTQQPSVATHSSTDEEPEGVIISSTQPAQHNADKECILSVLQEHVTEMTSTEEVQSEVNASDPERCHDNTPSKQEPSSASKATPSYQHSEAMEQGLTEIPGFSLSQVATVSDDTTHDSSTTQHKETEDSLLDNTSADDRNLELLNPFIEETAFVGNEEEFSHSHLQGETVESPEQSPLVDDLGMTRPNESAAIIPTLSPEQPSTSMLEHSGACLEQNGSQLEHSGTHLEQNGSQLEENGSQLEHSGTHLEQNGTLLEQNGSQLEHSGTHLEQNGSQLEHSGTHSGGGIFEPCSQEEIQAVQELMDLSAADMEESQPSVLLSRFDREDYEGSVMLRGLIEELSRMNQFVLRCKRELESRRSALRQRKV